MDRRPARSGEDRGSADGTLEMQSITGSALAGRTPTEDARSGSIRNPLYSTGTSASARPVGSGVPTQRAPPAAGAPGLPQGAAPAGSHALRASGARATDRPRASARGSLASPALLSGIQGIDHATVVKSAAERRARSVCSKELRTPVVLDLITDRVRSRSLTVLTAVLVFALVFSTVLQPLFHDPFNARIVAAKVGQVNVTVPPPAILHSGRRAFPQMVVLVASANGAALENQEVTATVEPRHRPFIQLSLFQIPLMRGTTWSRRLQSFTGVEVVSGSVATSIGSGLAFFENFIVRGQAGGIDIRFDVRGVPANIPVTAVLVSDVALVQHAFNPPRVPITLPVSRPFPVAHMPRFQIRDASHRPIVGRRCVLSSAPFSIAGAPRWRKEAIYRDATSLPSDENGTVAWPEGFRVAGAAESATLPAVNCEGVLSIYGYWPIYLATSASALEIHTMPSASVVEGEVFDVTPVVRLVDAAGQPVPGQLVFASVRNELGLQYVTEQPECVVCQLKGRISKEIAYAVSEETDEDGLARFPSMSFTVEGAAGPYILGFDHVGLPTILSDPVTVSTSVAEVTLVVPGNATPAARMLPPCGDDAAATGDTSKCCYDDGGDVDRCNGNVLPRPALYVSDAKGAPRAGKTATAVTAVPLDDASFPPSVRIDEVATGDDGYVVLDIMFAAAASGRYSVTVSVDGIESNSMIVVVQNYHGIENSTCAAMNWLGPAAEVQDFRISTNTVYQATNISVINSWGRPVAGQQVVGNTKLSLGATAPPHGVSGTDGIATISNIGPLQSYTASTFAQFTSGVEGSCSTTFKALTVTNTIDRIVVEHLPGGCVAGQPLGSQPRIRVVDAHGSPVGGHHFASIQIIQYPAYLTERRDIPGQWSDRFPCLPFTRNPLAPTCHIRQSPYFFENTEYEDDFDDDGVIDWSNHPIALPPGRPGLYVFAFYVDGVVGGVVDVDCQPTEGTAPAALEFLLEGGPPTDTAFVGDIVLPVPKLRVLNAAGDPVAGQQVKLGLQQTRRQPRLPTYNAPPEASVTLCSVETFPYDRQPCECFSEDCAQCVEEHARFPVSLPSDANGIAEFPGLRFCAGDPRMLDSFTLYGELYDWSQPDFSGIYTSTVATFPYPLGFRNPVGGVSLTVPLNSHGALGAVLPTQPVVDIELVDEARVRWGDVLRGGKLQVVMLVADAPSEAARHAVRLENNIAEITRTGERTGRAVFFNVRLDVVPDEFGFRNYDVAVGKYRFMFDVYGARSSLTESVVFQQTPQQLTIVQQPASTAVVRQLFATPAVVRAAMFNGAPLTNVRVAAEVVQGSGHATLDPSRARAITDSNGMATFFLLHTSAVPGNYTYAFSVESGLRTSQTRGTTVFNVVDSITIATAPSDVAVVPIVLDQTPVVRVLDANGAGVQGRTVIAQMSTREAAAAVSLQGYQVAVDADGFARFRDLAFVDAPTGDYEVVFDCDGINSETVTIHVTNPNEFDASGLDRWKSGIYATAAMLFPLFWGNSARHSVVLLFVATAFAFGVVIISGAYLVVINDYVGGVFLYPDPYLNFLGLSLLLIALAAFCGFMSVTALTLTRRTGYLFHHSRRDHFRALVKRLLPVGHHVLKEVAAAILHVRRSGARGATELTADQVDAIVQHLGEESKTTYSKAKTRPSSFIENVRERVRSMIDPPITKFARYEGYFDFFYPQRLQVGAAISLYLALLIAVGVGVLTSYFLFEIDVAKKAALVRVAEIEGYAADYGRQAAELAGVDYDAGIDLARESTDVGSDLVLNAATQALQAEGTVQAGMVIWALNTLRNNNIESTAAWLSTRVKSAGVLTAVFSFLLICVLWWQIFTRYRRRILDMRQGKYFVDKRKFGAKASINFIGQQGWHAVMAQLAIVPILFSIVFTIEWLALDGVAEVVTEYLNIDLGKILGDILGASLILKTIEVVFLGCIATRGDTIYHFRWFSLFDGAYLFVGWVKGSVVVAVRFITTFLLGLLTFARIDDQQLPDSIAYLDPGFHAYASMALMDHQANNPILNTLCFAMWDEIKLRRWLRASGVRLAVKRSKQRTAAIMWLAVTLKNNPQLIVERARQRAAKDPAYAAAFVGGIAAGPVGF